METAPSAIHICAEIGTSHGGSIEKAKELIRAAADAGADSVKFQWVYADEILHPATGLVTLPGGNISLYNRFKELEVDSDFFATAGSYAREHRCGFICSPFGSKSLEELAALNPDGIKIASPELNHLPLLRQLNTIRGKQEHSGQKPVPIILSTGVSRLKDIENAVSCFTSNLKDITLLHCITAYPAPETEYNTALIKNLRNIFGLPTGISDHSLDPILIPVLAAASGAVFIEKHITLSRTTAGLDDPVALEPDQFYRMVTRVRDAEQKIRQYGSSCGGESVIESLKLEFGTDTITKAIGDGIKKLAPTEAVNYGRTNRSIHAVTGIKKGQTITADNTAILRTEKVLSPGLSPEYIDEIIGSIATRDITAGEGITWQHLLSVEPAT